jgi:DNA-binding transcriptional regulator GbsR (MarR family)
VVHDEQASQFAEDIALWFEQSGMPRMAGRVLGWLLVCDPPHQSAEQLSAALGASRGSISTVTRLLAGNGMIERTAVPGDRRTYHRAVADWSGLLEAQHQRIKELRGVLEGGLDAMAAAPADRAGRLRQIHAFARFWEDELAAVLQRRAQEQDPQGGGAA